MCLLFFFFKQKTAYEMRISDWSSDVCSSDLAIAGARPFGQPAAFLVRVDQPLHDLAVALGVHQREEGEDRAPRVPETVVGVELAVVHLAVIRAVVDDLAGRVLLEEFARELQHPVKRRIEGAAVVFIGVVYARSDGHTSVPQSLMRI